MEALTAEEKAVLTSRVAADKKAMQVLVLDMRDASSMTDYFLICSGGSERQVQAIADAIDEQLSQSGIASLGVEGYREGHWILMDYGDLIVHIFSGETREFYGLEQLWANAPKLEVNPEFASMGPHQGASIG
jgi:ribosome-associated protein